MIWADRVAIVFGLLLSPVFFLAQDKAIMYDALIFVGFVWFVLRSFDFIASGSVRRG